VGLTGYMLVQAAEPPASPASRPSAAATFAGSGVDLITVQAVAARGAASFEGVVEAVRQSAIAAQVAGTVTAVLAHAGAHVAAGEVLVRIDAHAADQGAEASQAQARAANALLEAARQEVERQRRLFARGYISQAALDRAEANFGSTQAQAQAQLAQADAARASAGYFVVRAPYAGVVSEVPVNPGDMALPGRPLLTLYDPARLRVTAQVPQGALSAGLRAADTRLVLEDGSGARIEVAPASLEVLPAADPLTHTVVVRLDLPRLASAPVPGTFARLQLPVRQRPGEDGDAARVYVPEAALLRRAEFAGVFVAGSDGRLRLRQVRAGERNGGQVEILAGLSGGEQVARDARLAAAHQQ
jgi:RND family efflux transporter MFP subunit